jgi:hypothetical protein
MTIEQLLVTVLLAALPEESITCAVKLNVPGVVGVPVIAPVAALSVKPAGRDPRMIEYVYAATPPVAVNADEYATPTCPVPDGHVKLRGVGGFVMIIVQFVLTVLLAALPDESIACAVKLNVPGATGVPVIAPVEPLRLSPGGRVPSVMV